MQDAKRIKPQKMCIKCSSEFPLKTNVCHVDGDVLVSLTNATEVGWEVSNQYRIIELIATKDSWRTFTCTSSVNEATYLMEVHSYPIPDETTLQKVAELWSTLTKVEHDFLIPLRDYGIPKNGLPFLISEFPDGTTLQNFVQEKDNQGATVTTLNVLHQIAEAVSVVHEMNLVHRNLTPENIIVTQVPDQTFKARLQVSGIAALAAVNQDFTGVQCRPLYFGTSGDIRFSSPELCMGKGLAPTTDVYSFGILMFFVLTGKAPFRGSSTIKTASMHLTETPPALAQVRPDLRFPTELERIMRRCLEKDPTDRFQSMREVRAALTNVGFDEESYERPEVDAGSENPNSASKEKRIVERIASFFNRN